MFARGCRLGRVWSNLQHTYSHAQIYRYGQVNRHSSRKYSTALYPAYVNITSFFYPLGNTPAVSFTQSLPPEEPARILSLGCGDARNIFFTAYAEANVKARQIDITCCDIQRTVIARNMLLFTLLLDDEKRKNQQLIWNVYYHMFLDGQSFKLLQTQAKKLHGLSTSLDAWHKAEYGTRLRFCDQVTLTKVREIWKSYFDADSTRSRSEFEKARKTKTGLINGTGTNLTALGSAAPFTLDGIAELPLLFERYWDHGTTVKDTDARQKSDIPNPMFSCQIDNLTLHYATDPLLGFHLAIAYAPLTPSSPLALRQKMKTSLDKVVATAQQQFHAWSSAFRKCSQQGLTLRFFAGEALAFCHALDQKRVTGDDSSVRWYRGPYMVESLNLDSEDYAFSGNAPLSFNMIDTSNLIDHVGAINVLVATAPLLERSLSASLVTESLVSRQRDNQDMDGLLCGNFQTLSTLLGLFPVEYWTNETLVSPLYKGRGQLYNRLSWRPTIPAGREFSSQPRLWYDEGDLAQVLYQTYLKMFESEDSKTIFANLDIKNLQKVSLPYYTRATFASFLRCVKSKVTTDWDKMIKILLDHLESDKTLAVGRNFLQELCVQMHLFGVSSGLISQVPLEIMSRIPPAAMHLAWPTVPDVVNVTLRIPRSALHVFTQEPRCTPPLNCHLFTPSGEFSFAVLQLAFGKAHISGQRVSGDLALHLTEDGRAWNGKSPLWVSFCVPTWILLHEPQNLSIALSLQATPQTVATFLGQLGVELNVFKTSLADVDNVYITKCHPNLSVAPSALESPGGGRDAEMTADEAVWTSIIANIKPGTARLTTLTGRLDVISDDLKSQLNSGAMVETVQVSPCIIGIKVGKSSELQLRFPAPVLNSQNKVRIARKSSYVEVIVPLASPAEKGYFSEFMYPSLLGAQSPVVWGMSRVSLTRMPTIDMTTKRDPQWLVNHISHMFSDSPAHHDTRAEFKASLLTMFSRFAGISGTRARFFGLNDEANGGVHILVLVAAMRLDLATQSVVLDAAILPLTRALLPKILTVLRQPEEQGIYAMNVDAAELRAWKMALPAMVERCREWSHGPNCEYRRTGRIPVTLEAGQSPLCSCGNGKMPSRFIAGIQGWDAVAKYAVRAAISPSFSVPLVESQESVGGGSGRRSC